MKIKSTLRQAILTMVMLFVKTSTSWADCGTVGTPIAVGSSTNWSAIAALTACSSQLTTNNGVYTGNVYINLSNGVQIDVNINLTIYGSVILTNQGTNAVFNVKAGRTLTIVGDLGDATNNNVDYTVEGGGLIVVTGTLIGKNNNTLGGSGVISAGATSFQGDFDCAAGGCPVVQISNCPSSGTVCPSNPTNICTVNVGGNVASDQSTCGSSLNPVALNVSGYSGNSLRWEQSINGGASWTGINEISDTYDPPLLTVTTMFRVVVLNTTSTICNSFSSAATISIGAPGPAGAITGPASVCKPVTGMIYSVAPVSGATSYTWAYSGTGATINGTGTTVTVDFAAGATNGNLTVRGTNACGNGTVSPNKAITLTAATPPTVNQPTDKVVCEGLNAGTATTFTGTATSYNWTNNLTIINLAASGTGNIAAFVPTNTGFSPIIATVTVTPINASCSGVQKSFTYTVNPKPGSAGTIVGPTPVCRNGTGYTYTVPTIPAATSYVWAYTGTGATITGTGNTVTIDFSGTATSGSLRVTGSNSCGTGTQSPALNITVNAGTAPTVNQPSNQTLCPGNSTTAVTFTGTGATSYTWTNDNNSIGLSAISGTGNIASFTALNPGIVDNIANVVVTPVNASCKGTTKTFTYTVNPVVPPSVSIAVTSGSNPACNGSSVTFTASPTNGGGSPGYQWTKNGTNIGGATSVTYTGTAGTAFVNGDLIRVVLTSNLNCVSPSTATSSPIAMSVTSNVTPSVSIAVTSGSNPACNGTSVTFTATPTNGGGTPGYQWTKNGSNIGGATSVTYTGTAGTDFINGDLIRVVMTSNATCPSPATATSAAINIGVTATVTPSVSIAVTSGTNPACNASSVTFTATPTNGGGTPGYQWTKNGSNIGGATSVTYTGTAGTDFINGDLIRVVMTSNATCPSPATATSAAINIGVTATVTPSVSIAVTSGTNPACNASSVTFTATPTNGGGTPGYQWTKNGSNIGGATSVTYTGTAGTDFINGDLIRVVITSNATCPSPATATSAAINIGVTPTVTPSVSINSNVGNSICAGATVIFTATPTNGGGSPTYNFRVNGSTAQNSASNTFSTSALTNGQTVDVIMTSNATCPLPATATSTGIVMTVNPNLTPTISITDSQVNLCALGITFTANITNGGASPAYQWKKNGSNVGTNSATFTATNLINGDLISCVLTSNATCLATPTATSNTITVNITSTSTTWLGISNDWSVGSPINWSNGYPSSNTTAIIPAGTPNNPQINDFAECFNLVIQTGASLTINSVNSIDVYGSITNNGTFNAGFGDVNFVGCTGSSAQQHLINGSSVTSFFNLSLNDLAGASLQSNAQITGTLDLINGTFTNSGAVFTFISTATGTAHIGPVAATANYAGNITMQRYAPGPKTGWAQLGTPIQGATLAQWYDNFPMQGFTGVFGGGFTNFVSVYTYNEPTAGVFDANGSYIPATNVTNSVPVGKGFWLYLGSAGAGGSSTTNTAPITIDVTGQPQIGNFNFNPTYTNSGNVNDDGYNLVANPYPSAIDWLSASWTKTNIDNAIYMYQADNGQYASFVGGISTNGGSRYIASSQGFYVKANAASPVLTITENAKVGQNPVLIKEEDPANVLRIKVEGDDVNDEMVIRLTDLATDQFDGSFDAKKIFSNIPGNPSISSISNGKDLAINSLPFSGNTMTVPVRVNVGSNGMYHLSWSGVEKFPEGSCFVLEDLNNGNKTLIEKDAIYYFTANAGFNAPRFVIHISTPLPRVISQASCLNSQDGSITLTNPSQASCAVILSDASGNIIKEAVVASTFTFDQLTPGHYQINYPNATACGPMNQTIEITAANEVNAKFDASSTTVFTNEAITFTTAQSKGNNISWDLGDGTVITGKNVITHQYQTEGVYAVTLTNLNGLCSGSESMTLNVTKGSALSANSMDVSMQNGLFYAVFYFNENTVATISIMNALGQEVTAVQQYEGKSGKVKLDLENAPEGVYLVTIKSGECIMTKKIVK